MKKFAIVSLTDRDGEMALIEILDNNELKFVVVGDAYHNNIHSFVEGFFMGINYANVEHVVIDKVDATEIVNEEVYTIDELNIHFDGENILVSEK